MKKNITKETYDKSAKALAEKFNKIKNMKSEISLAFSFLNKKNPFVLEIGCGNGRDAMEISKYTNNYLGIDISKNMIKIAKKVNPKAEFIVFDVRNFEFPDKIDIVFASASLLHLDKEDISKVLKDAHKKIVNNGVFYISLKYGKYRRVIKKDEYGTRVYYLYTPKDIEMISKGFKTVYVKKQRIRGQDWITIILKKKTDKS